ncbi:LysE family translocator [Pelagibacterium halotolerans]|uniref:LysE family translocator n=1 Tax=Pelagibacterium halotolerans TaxID=531813 RepID=UPI0038501097
MSIEFLLTSLVVVLLPGTGVIYTLAIGLGRGFRASIAAAFGCTMGIVPAALASIVGLAAIFHTSAVAFTLIKYAGAVYLLYMAWSILRDKSALTVNAEREPVSLGRVAVSGMLLNILNPKLSLFFLAFLPQFVSIESANATALMLGHALVFMAITFVGFIGYGACAALARDYVIARPRVVSWLKRGFAGIFGFLGLRLALTDT